MTQFIRFFITTIFLNIFVLFPILAEAGVTEVPVSDAPSLQAALSAAEIDANDTVITLAAGNYTTAAGAGTFTYDSALTKSLTLQGAGKGLTVLDGGNADQVVFINHAGADGLITLSKMTIQKGQLGTERGAGLFVNGDHIDVIVEEMEFDGNINDGNHGGGFFIETLIGKVRFDRNLVTNNQANDTFSDGGGGFIYASNKIEVTNNIFYKNAAEQSGGGMEAENSNIFFVNNTFIENTAGDQGGGIFIDVFDVGSSGIVYNNIAFGNIANGGPDAGADLFLDNADLFNVPGEVFHNLFSQACYENGCNPTDTAGITAGNNDNRDPLLADPAGGDFSLSLGSPAIDAGNSAPPEGLPALDFAGAARHFGTAPDLGALEALPLFQLSSNALNFGVVAVGDQGFEEISLENLGVAPLAITGINLSSSSPFTLDPSGGSQPCGVNTPTIAGGGSCTMSVLFNPSAEGAVTATIEFISDDPQNLSLLLTVSGTGAGSGGDSGGGCGLIRGEKSANGACILLAFMVVAFGAFKGLRLNANGF